MPMFQVPLYEINNRLARFQAMLAQKDIDAAIIRQNTDLYYFTGTVQDAHLIVPAAGAPCFLVRRDVARAEQQSGLRPVVALKSVREVPAKLFECCGTESVARIGLELDVLPADTFFFYDRKLFEKQQIVDIGTLVRQVRMIKSQWEIEMMRRAGGISQAVTKAVPGILRQGMRETDLCIELEHAARRAGHLGFARVRAFNMEIFFGHVLSGAEAAVSAYCDSPTGGPGVSPAFGQGAGDRIMQEGDLVSVDTMVNHHGYLNDQTRNFGLGSVDDRLKEAYRLSCRLHQWARENVRPGMPAGGVYDSLMSLAAPSPLGAYFMGCGDAKVSFIGHGLGLEVDEFPFIAKGQQMPLAAGMTFALEPKWVMPGIGVAGIENTYLVTDHGLESLNSAAEDLLMLPC